MAVINKQLGISKIKKKIRDIKRTLSRESQSAESIIENKRKLLVLEYDLGERTIDEKERDNASKYHKVKHFERTKLKRKMKQVEKKLEETVDEQEKKVLQNKLDNMHIDTLYINFFPKVLTYISLFPKENGETEKQKKKKEEIRQMIRQCVEKGDNECEQMTKHYRLEYRQKLIKTGKIPDAAPMDEGMEVEPKPVVKEEEFVINGDKSNRDDFFE
ncbi:hypothetical protein BDB01DRAFT_804616 [Pilobolus umbonatus]|nr:hypothetical protein BDB01DRAFT_804616 [Pilobolus umbonatus]